MSRFNRPQQDSAAHAASRCRLAPDQCLFRIDEQSIQSGNKSSSAFAIIGQDRAVLALDLALNMKAKGYNLFVSGPAGTGKRTAIKHALKNLPPDLSRLRDIALGHNFQEPESPIPVFFPAGTALGFRSELREFLLNLSAMVSELSHQTNFRSIRDRLMLRAESEEQQLIFDFEGKLSKEGFKIVQTEEDDETRTDILPLVNDEVSDFDTLQEMVSRGEMSETNYTQLRERQLGFVDEMQGIFETLHKRRVEVRKQLDRLRIETLAPYVNEHLDSLKARFPQTDACAFLDRIGSHILSHESFIIQMTENPPPEDLETGEPADEGSAETPRINRPAIFAASQQARPVLTKTWQGLELPDHLKIYDINILVDHHDSQTNPVIFEQYPDYAKLFGFVEPVQENSQDNRPPHLLVRAGSILKASGGYLVLKAEDILRDEDLYIALKRALQEEAVEIRSPANPAQPAAQAVKPQPISLDVKVILMGPDGLYEALFDRDEEFEKLFKVPAEFDSSVDRTPEISQAYVDFFTMICREAGLLPLDSSSMAALLEHAVRISEFRNKLTTRFSLLADIVKEADYWARKSGAPGITRSHIRQALSAREFLYNLPEEKIDEQILQGEILMSVKGTATGRINGLAVMDRGYYSFGRPMVISAQVAPGSDGVVNVEREVGLSGEIHDKGTFIVESYIKATYARDFPLSISASICFEQSYSEIDGDSASSTEVYALLSAISEVPLRQDIAVTGSVNQMGEIQPVGGVVEKIEGFHAVCRKAGLTGGQGVIIPRQNIQNLVLNHEVQESIQSGEFHIWAISTINEGMEILSGLPAGERNAKGHYDPGSLNFLVERRLREMLKAGK